MGPSVGEHRPAVTRREPRGRHELVRPHPTREGCCRGNGLGASGDPPLVTRPSRRFAGKKRRSLPCPQVLRRRERRRPGGGAGSSEKATESQLTRGHASSCPLQRCGPEAPFFPFPGEDSLNPTFFLRDKKKKKQLTVLLTGERQGPVPQFLESSLSRQHPAQSGLKPRVSPATSCPALFLPFFPWWQWAAGRGWGSSVW